MREVGSGDFGQKSAFVVGNYLFRSSSSSFWSLKRYVGEFKGTRCLKKTFHIVLCEGGSRTYCGPSTFSPPMLKVWARSMKKTNKAKRIRFIHTSWTLSTTATETCYDCIHHSGQYLAECTGAKSHEGISGSIFSSRHQPSSLTPVLTGYNCHPM